MNAPQNGRFKKLKNVTLPVLKMKKDTEYYFKITGPMHVGKEIASGKPDPVTGEIKPAKAPAHICEAINLDTMEPCVIICSTVFRKELDGCYPNNTYVGKCFGYSFTKVEGKDYNIPSIWEVEEPESDDKAPEYVGHVPPSPQPEKQSTSVPATKTAAKKK